jgi:type VI protein secretion system component VasK
VVPRIPPCKCSFPVESGQNWLVMLGVIVLLVFLALFAIVWRVAAPDFKRRQDERNRPVDEEQFKRPDNEGDLL